jgi:hypothetical protein
MDTASLELCKELYKFTKWDGLQSAWLKGSPINGGDYVGFYHGEDYEKKLFIAPAYSLGYLLRKIKHLGYFEFQYHDDGQWHFYRMKYEDQHNGVRADSPENAVAELIIELFKQGHLK